MKKLYFGVILISLNRLVYAILANFFIGTLFWNDYLIGYKTAIIEIFGWLFIVSHFYNYYKIKKTSKIWSSKLKVDK